MTFVKRLQRVAMWLGLSVLVALLPQSACALITATVQGTVYRADGGVAGGTLLVSWPSFATSANEAVAAGNKTVTIGSDGWMSVSLASNAGSSPVGTYYTAVYHLNDGTTSTEYWIVPASATASLASVRARVVPAAMALQTVTRQYVDSSVANVSLGLMQASGGIMNGPLGLSGDPTTDLQAATKHYVDRAASGGVSKTGDTMTGPLTAPMINGKTFAMGTTLQQAINVAGLKGAVEIPANYAGKDSFSNPNGIAVTDLRTDVPVTSRNVKEFGARCDGITDDSSAIQAAFDYAYDHQTSGPPALSVGQIEISFPQGTCYVATPINYRGESFHGTSVINSRIQGAPGLDIFLADDPADSSARRCCISFAHVHDITLVINASVDANRNPNWAAKRRGAGQGSIFANTFAGWSGQTVMGAVTAGATTLPLTTALNLSNYHNGVSYFGWVTVGTEYMQYYGLSNTGCPNGAPSCLLNVVRGVMGTTASSIADAAVIAPLNPLDPTNTTDWIPAWTVGNCAIAFPARDAMRINGTVPFSHGMLSDINVSLTGGAQNGNNTCALYMQAPTYGIRVDRFNINSSPDYGIVSAPPFYNSDFAIAHAASSDGNSFTRMDMMTANPFIAWTGTKNTISDSTAYAESNIAHPSGGTLEPTTPHNLVMYSLPLHEGSGDSGIGSFLVSNFYIEANTAGGTVVPVGPLAQIGGYNHTFIADQMGPCGVCGLSPIVWDARTSVIGIDVSNGAMQLNGNDNVVTGNYNGIIDNGIGNRFRDSVKTQYGFAPYNPLPARPFAVSKITPDFLTTGSVIGDWYQSLDDLFLTPEEYLSTLQTFGTGVITSDPAVPVTGKYLELPSPGGFFMGPRTLDEAQDFNIGRRAPKGKGTFYVALKARAAATQLWQLTYSGGVVSTSATFNLTTNWAIYSMPYDFTTLAVGTPILFQSGGANPATTVQIGYIAFVPQTDYLKVANLEVQSISAQALAIPQVTTGVLKYNPIAQTQLASGALGASDSTLAIWTGITGVFPPSGGVIQIDNELISYTNITQNPTFTFQGLTRGSFGTAAAAHGGWTGVSLVSFVMGDGSAAALECMGSKCGFGSGAPQYPLSFGGGGFGGGSDGVWNASGYRVGGVALGSMHLSDGAGLAKLNATQTWTGAQSFGAVTASTVNATTTLQVNGAALASSNLSDGAGLAKLSTANVFTLQQTAPNFVGVIGSEADVAFSATPTFSVTANLNYLALTGNVTSSTLAAGKNGQSTTIMLCQDATGSRTFVWPANVRGGITIGSTASKCSSQVFIYVTALSKWVAAASGITNE